MGNPGGGLSAGGEVPGEEFRDRGARPDAEGLFHELVGNDRGDVAGGRYFSELLYRWVGFGLLFSPLLLIARLRDTKRSLLLLSLLVMTFALTLEEVRWGYFFALVYAMSLPWQFSLFKRQVAGLHALPDEPVAGGPGLG